MSSIRLSPKYGVNPTIPVCFWCGEEKNEIALMGRISRKKTSRTAWGSTIETRENDIEAPRHCVLDYEPCEKCKENMAKGVTIFGTSLHPIQEDMPPISQSPEGYSVYPVPKYLVLSEDGVRHIFDETTAKALIESRKGFAPEELVDQLSAAAQAQNGD